MSASVTLDEARSILRHGISKGIRCPCCSQYARQYRRKLNSGMARSLIWLVQYHDKHPGWIDVPQKAPRHVVNSRELDKLLLWTLAERAVNSQQRKRGSGLWRPTLLGCEFVAGRATVASHAIIYNGELRGLQGRPITIQESLGKKFDYAELLAEAAA